MILPIDIEKKEFSRDKRGFYNATEVDTFLDLIIVDYEKVLQDNRSMAHKIKFLEKQLEESQRSDTAMLDTLETAKRLMADISASAERRAELMMRDAQLESENMILEAKNTVRSINDEHLVLKHKVERLRANFKHMLKAELEKLEGDEYSLLPELDRSDIPEIESEFEERAYALSDETLVMKKKNMKDTITGEDGDEIENAINMGLGENPAEKSDGDINSNLEENPNGEPAELTEDIIKSLAEKKESLDDTIIIK